MGELMTLEELKSLWKAPQRDTENAKALWSSQADETVYTTIPNFESSGFLRLLDEEHMLENSYDVLDIGCGTGVYSAAISYRINSALGYDIADGMLKTGRRMLEKNKISNVTLKQADWQDIDIGALGLENRFDLVLAHTTPAICDLETFQKMIRASRRFCAISVFTRPNQPIMQTVHDIVGVKLDDGYFAGYLEKSMTYMFDYLYQTGYSPKFFYEKIDYSFVQKLEDSYPYYLDAVCAHKKLSTDEVKHIKDYVATKAVDGIVTEKMNPTIVTIYWDILEKA
jgi:SAM-dependent methyltransferase